METREEILKELRAIAPNLASLEKRNYFTVPENYFGNFRVAILDLVETDVVKEKSASESHPEKRSIQVPSRNSTL